MASIGFYFPRPPPWCRRHNSPPTFPSAGLSLETFRAAGDELGWQEGVQYQFEVGLTNKNL
jgi:hypothetical protein